MLLAITNIHLNGWLRPFLMMKITLFLLTSVFFSAAANTGYSQQARLNLKIKDQSFRKVMREVRKQSGLNFVYESRALVDLSSVSFEAQDATIYEMLDILAQSNGLEYEIEDHTVILRKAPEKEKEEIEVSGKITDENGEGLPGATVIEVSTTNGTVTDIDGNYRLSVSEGAKLRFSFVGFLTQEVPVNGRQVIDVQMNPDAQQLDEVVVTGYQTIDRKLFTGSADYVKAENVKIDGVADISRTLQGEAAGVEVENVSGTFGVAPVFRIRGSSSILGNNRPLWVVDGVVLEDAVELTNEDITSGNLNTILSSSTVGLNPEDIESFQILKDVSATGLYGSRAMNGVVVITTKKGRKGKAKINFQSAATIRGRPKYSQFDYLTSGAEMEVYQELYEKNHISSRSGSSHGALSKMFYEIEQDRLDWGPQGSLNYDYLQRYADANTDWFDLLFKTGVTVKNDLSISAGSDKMTYRVSLSYTDDQGQTITDKAKNYIAFIRTDLNLNQKVNLGFKLTGNVREQQTVGVQNQVFDTHTRTYNTSSFDINPFSYAVQTSRSITPYDENGNLEFFRRNYKPFNILHEIAHNKTDINLLDFTFQANVNWQIFKNLSFTTVLQGRRYKSESIQSVHERSNAAEAYRADDDPQIRKSNELLYNPTTKDPAGFREPYSILPQGGFRKLNYNDLTSYTIRSNIDYSNTIALHHQINLLIGQELRYNDRTSHHHTQWAYLFDRGGLALLPHPDWSRYLGQPYYGDGLSRYRAASFFSNISYAFKEKYLLNGSVRLDGDNRTGASTQARWLPTWNVSVGWNIHEESWMSIKGLELLKLKSTYGLSGDNPINANAGLILNTQKVSRIGTNITEIALNISNLPNNDLTFEKLYEWNLALEAGLFRNRFFTELAYYQRESIDLLGEVHVHGIGRGKISKNGNVGEMITSGLEITLRTVNVVTAHFQWSTRFTYSAILNNKVTKWIDQFNQATRASYRVGGAVAGYPRRSLFSNRFAGLDDYGLPTFYNSSGEVIKQHGTDIINGVEALKYEGSIEATSFGGMNHTFKYKNWNLSIGLVYRYGNKIRLEPLVFQISNDQRSLPGVLVNRWLIEGDEDKTNIPAIPVAGSISSRAVLVGSKGDIYRAYNESDIRVADGSFIRLKSVQLTYTLPQAWFNNIFLRSARLTFSGYNLWLLYADKKLNGIDPEFYNSGGVALPPVKNYTLSLNIQI